MHKIIHDAATGEIEQIELTSAEIAELKNAETKIKAEEATRKAELDAKAAEKSAVFAKLGLTAEEVEALLS